MEKKNLNPMNNPQKSRYHFYLLRVLDCSFYLRVRFSYIVIGGHVAGTSLAEKLNSSTKVVKSSKQNAERSMTAMECTSEDAKSYSIKLSYPKRIQLVIKIICPRKGIFDKIATILHKNLSIEKRAEALKILQDGAK